MTTLKDLCNILFSDCVHKAALVSADLGLIKVSAAMPLMCLPEVNTHDEISHSFPLDFCMCTWPHPDKCRLCFVSPSMIILLPLATQGYADTDVSNIDPAPLGV